MTMNRSVASSAFRWLLLGLVVLSFSAASFAQVFVSVRFGPPALPIYAQPLCPGPGFMWTPGYWGWNDDGGYYWVPGTWVIAPVGMLWTPGYWGWGGGFYAWHAGYWGPHIGFYGGINYGFGYGGVGFVGGEWRGGAFFYNRAVTNVSVTSVTNVYTHTVVVNENHAAFNGGEGGVTARPTPAEEAAEHEQHTAALAAQSQHEQMASQNRANFASENHGRPAVAATAKAGDFSSHSAVSARAAGSEYHAPAMSPKEARVPASEAAKGSSNSSEGVRSFTPPNKSASSTSANEKATANENRNESSRASESQSKQSAPKQNASKPSKPPKNNNNNRRSSPPPREHGR